MFARVLLITFVARFYGIDDFGRLGEAVAMLELLAAFATFGLTKTLLGNLGTIDTPGGIPAIDPGKHIVDGLALSRSCPFSPIWVCRTHERRAGPAERKFVTGSCAIVRPRRLNPGRRYPALPIVRAVPSVSICCWNRTTLPSASVHTWAACTSSGAPVVLDVPV